jgi:diketogulonate reductase-like aldo/keto reductase
LVLFDHDKPRYTSLKALLSTGGSADRKEVEPMIDMWYLHSPDRSVPFEETLHEVNNLYLEGHFRRFGISN